MILIAPDKFKSTFKASETAELIESSLHTFLPEIQTYRLPLADGGEGSCELLAEYFNAKPVNLSVSDPLMRSINTNYYYSESSKTALIETAKASGLYLLSENEKNPLQTNSYGSGELLADAIKKGAKILIVTLGGSAVNDAGAGLAHALGFQFYDADKRSVFPVGKTIGDIREIDHSKVKYNLSNIQIIVLSDVENPLYGEKGASKVFAKQKGANNQEVEFLENSIMCFSEILEKYKPGISCRKGTGAAGGMAAGLSAFFGAQIQSGSDFIIEKTNFENHLKKAELLITGEGKLDSQSFDGKLVGKLLQKAKKMNKKTAVICGINELKGSGKTLYTGVYALFDKETPLLKAQAETPEKIHNAVRTLLKDFKYL
jgi:glycerate 2-kinase